MSTPHNKKEFTKQEIIDNFLKINEQFKKENPNSKSCITARYYETHGVSNRQYNKFFTSYEDLKKEALGVEDIEIYKSQQKIKSLKDENAQLKKEKEHLLERTMNEEHLLELYKETKLSTPIQKKFDFTKVKDEDSKEAILILSDFHLGEVIKANEFYELNSFDSVVMKKRIDRVINYFVFYCKKFNITKAHFLFLGDLFSGSHHDELIRSNELNEVDALFLLQEYIAQKLLEVESCFSSIKCEFLVGNHSRIPMGKPQYKQAGILNYEYILAKQLQLQFDLIQKQSKQKKIVINVSDGLFKVVTIAERKFFITHGHIMGNGSNSFAGIPYYSLSAQSAKLFGALYDKEDFQDVLIGHLHTSARVKIPSGNLYINGSIIGGNEYALYKMRAMSEAEQTMLIVNKGRVINEITLRGDN